jgi:hypothetical protein
VFFAERKVVQSASRFVFCVKTLSVPIVGTRMFAWTVRMRTRKMIRIRLFGCLTLWVTKCSKISPEVIRERVSLFGIFTLWTVERSDEVVPALLPPEKVFVKIADNEMNRTSPFWVQRIGDTAQWLGINSTADGKTTCSLQFPEQALPQEDVDVRRLELIP